MSDLNKFTPGPWVALNEECGVPYIRIRGTTAGGRFKVANVQTPVYAGVHSRELDETRANANLISAAPDLLEALESLFEVYGDEPETDYAKRAHDQVRSAIAKARGQS